MIDLANCMLNKLLRIATLLSVVVLPCCAYAQTVHDEMRGKLVYLHARGIAKSGPNQSLHVDTFGTGTIVSPDGLILTTYHLITQLGDVHPGSVTIKAHLADKSSAGKPVAIIDALTITDLMMLKMPPDLNPYESAKLGRAVDHNDADLLFTSGFPKDSPYRKQQGLIQGKSGPGGFVWTTSMRYEPSQSGSPVYNASGEVVAVVKGNNATTGYIIPIGYADALLTQIRLREIRAAMTDFEHLRKKFDWHAEMVGDNLRIFYEKTIPGKPHVNAIDIRVSGIGRYMTPLDDESPTTKLQIMKKREHKPSGDIGLTGKAFVINDFRQKIDTLKADHELAEFTNFRIDLIPYLSDGTTLRRKTVFVQ